MIRRFYVHNFRCLENFELPVSGQSSTLLIGKNGSGKSVIGDALGVLQKIGRGTNRVGELVKPKDFFLGRTDTPMRFEIEVELEGSVYEYVVAFDLPEGSDELRVSREKLAVGGQPVYSRTEAEVMRRVDWLDLIEAPVGDMGKEFGNEAAFPIDWDLVTLPIIQERSRKDPLSIFKQWLTRLVIIRPTPSLISGDSAKETLQPNPEVTDFGGWFSGILAHFPAAYARIEQYLKQVMPDLKDIKNPAVGKRARSLEVQFSNGQGSVSLPFGELSDGEKCFMICALVLAANDTYGPLVCFWDEPDTYLSLDEAGHFVLALRKAFQDSGQFIMTSHNPEGIRQFSDENTLVLYRKSHLEPTMARRLSEVNVGGDLVGALIRGDVEP